ncbi:kinase-like domain-containing protein [Gautieria morchelliformis]|nr:kinase-like domain-containing protein [Gautieria morchelliformis]
MNNPTYKVSNKLESMTPSFPSSGFHAFSGEPDSLTIAARNALFANLEIPVSDISPHDRDPLVPGGHSDIWRTHLMRDGVRTPVALKVLRRNGRTQDKVTESFQQEVAIWRVLDHENIAPLIGVCSNWHGGSPAIVSPWYENSTASQYLQRNLNGNLLSITKDMADGLAYMHGKGLVHGDIKSASVMIDEHGHARLIDFGLAHFVDTHVDVDLPEGFSIRWCAPELLQPGAISTPSSDVYAFASTILELLSGRVPYHTLIERIVISEVMKGILPSRFCGDFFSLPRVQSLVGAEALWELLQSCWVDAARRPNMSQMRLSLMSLE